MKHRYQSLLAAACALLTGLPALAQSYHSNDITPPGAATSKLTGKPTSKHH